MSFRRAAPFFVCLAVLHAPGGGELRIDVRHIAAFRSAAGYAHHLAPGTKTVVFVTTQSFGVVETPEEVQAAIHNCVDGADGQTDY